LPFPLPTVSPGLSALSPYARQVGRRAAERVAAALAAQLGGPVQISGRALPAAPVEGPGLVPLGLHLEALPAEGLLEVEAALAVGLVDRLAGGDGQVPPATSLTPVERSVVELLALVALAGAAEEDAVADALAPRLSAPGKIPGRPLCLEVSIAAGASRGRCRLLLPAEALRALKGPVELSPAVAGWRIEGWLASGSAALSPGEVDGLAPGDVLLLDEPPSPRAEIRLPGLLLRGQEDDGLFHLEEMTMAEDAGELSVTLVVEIARVSLPLSDLARLEPGSAFPLHAPRDGRVVLRLGERPVARGQLVEIEGALGVRLDSLEARP
jgi:type III secretion protein Q